MQQVFNRATKLSFSIENVTNDYYWVLGDRKNPPLLLLHGYTGNHNDLLSVAESLKEKYFIIVPDLPGWGKSPRFKKNLSIENYALYLKALLDSLKIHKITLVGHCMGTALCIEIAVRFPNLVEKLFLVSTPYIAGTMSEKIFLHLANITEKSPKKIRKVFFIWRSRFFVTPLSLYILKVHSLRKKINLIKHYIKTQPSQQEDAVEENFFSGIHYNYEKVKQIKVPIHLIHGANDVIIRRNDALKFHALIPSASLEFIPHSGHIPPVESPKSMASLILKY